MQFLFQEFFKKIFEFSEGSYSILTKYLVRAVFIIITLILMLVIIWAILSKNYLIIFIILAFFILGEIAHYIRKSREKIATNSVIQEKIKS